MEYAVVLATLSCIVILAVVALGFYALRKDSPGWVRVHTSLARVFTFSIETGKEPPSRQTEENGDGEGMSTEPGGPLKSISGVLLTPPKEIPPCHPP